MKKKQSSIEWYENKLIQLDIDFGGHKNYWVERKKLRDQAKAMHKKEIQYAYWEGGMDKPKGSKECEQYYNETYKETKN